MRWMTRIARLVKSCWRVYWQLGPKKATVPMFLVAVLLVCLSVSRAVIEVTWAFSSGDTTFVMEGKERVERGGVSTYEVYTSSGVYANRDSWLRFKHNSADLQGKLRPGKTYSCMTQGFRLPLLSLMENLIICNELEG